MTFSNRNHIQPGYNYGFYLECNRRIIPSPFNCNKQCHYSLVFKGLFLLVNNYYIFTISWKSWSSRKTKSKRRVNFSINLRNEITLNFRIIYKLMIYRRIIFRYRFSCKEIKSSTKVSEEREIKEDTEKQPWIDKFK